ncbi:MAG: PHP domain-containing protein [Acidimicrobiales bacterium]
MEPADALARIAYLLEAARAPTYKVRAFRNAAASVAAVEPGRLAELAGAGRLSTLTGVGDTTAKVVTEALAGRVPGYLEHLEAEAEPSGEAGALRALLRGDCHSHSTWSDGGSSIAEMAAAAQALGYEYLVLTDHSPRLTVAHGLDAARLRRQMEEVAELNARLAPFRVLQGIEVDILEDGSLDQDEELLAELDVVVASVHSKLRMEPRAMTERMVAAIESPLTDILGHCTGRILAGRGRPPSTFDSAEVFAACASTGTAVEINCRPERQDPPEALLAEAVEAGCDFAIDTDAHAPGQLSWAGLGCVRAVAAGIPPERVVNTRPLRRFVDWASERTPTTEGR